MEGKIIDGNKFTLEQTVRCYDVDAQMRLRPSAFMDYAQEMAYLAADAMGFGYDAMIKDGKAWVLSRLHFVFEDTPAWRDTLLLQTWHKGPSGPFYVRDFMFSDAATGKPRVRGTSSWVIMDITKRSLVRSTDLVELVNPATIRKEDSIAENAARVAMPRGVTPEVAGTHTVGYSDIDLQQHTNNARYVLWATNCIDCALLREHPFKELTINFNHETVESDKVDLLCYRSGLEFYIEGVCNGSQVFCLKINLQE